MNNFTSKILALTVAGGVSVSAAWADPGDNFNRTALGPSWTSNSGTLSILGKELVGTTRAIGTFNPAAKFSAGSEIVFLNGGTALQYGAIALGNIATGSNAFVKIQEQNGGGRFDHGAFYTPTIMAEEFSSRCRAPCPPARPSWTCFSAAPPQS